MYNKFSVIEFTSNTSTPRRNTSPVDSSSNSSSNSSNNQLNTPQNGQMPKKRGRPAKTTPSTQMVIKTTECIFQPIVFSMQAKKPDSWIANLNSKRKFTEGSETIHRSNYFELEDSYRTNNELAPMQKKVKVSNTIAETERREKTNQREWMTRFEQSVSKIEPSHTKPRIIRTSISIKELLN